MSVKPIKKSLLATICLLVLVAYGVESREVKSREAAQGVGAVARALARFPHERAAHKKIDCSGCHSIPAGEIDVKEFPSHTDCISCHNFAVEVFAKPATFCGICHRGRASSQQAALFNFPKQGVESDFGIDFSHPSHMKPLKAPVAHLQLTAGATARCTDCHRRVEGLRVPLPEMTIEAGHAGCFKCHGQAPIAEPGMRECAQCHRLDRPRPPHLFGIVKGFRHEDHALDTRPKKKSDVRFARPVDLLCAECHKSVIGAARLDDIKLPPKSYCIECHNGRVGLPDRLAEEVLESLERR